MTLFSNVDKIYIMLNSATILSIDPYRLQVTFPTFKSNYGKRGVSAHRY